jgi:hypothetical protein
VSRGPFTAEGFAYYATELRRGSEDPYVAYRLYEQHWLIDGTDAKQVLRRATIKLIETDPWFLATALPYFLEALDISDLRRLTPFVGTGPASKAASYLRAVLWFNARKGPHAPDRAGRAQLRRALEFLKRVPSRQRDLEWHEMVVGCYESLDFGRYKTAFVHLLKVAHPKSCAFPLIRFFGVLAAKKDWATYDKYRPKWDRLPPAHHACECYSNDLHTIDGLRAAAKGDWESIPASLEKAAAVRGCPHLNARGLRLDLVRLLIRRRRSLDACRKYLDRAAEFGSVPEDKHLAEMQRRLSALLP